MRWVRIGPSMLGLIADAAAIGTPLQRGREATRPVVSVSHPRLFGTGQGVILRRFRASRAGKGSDGPADSVDLDILITPPEQARQE